MPDKVPVSRFVRKADGDPGEAVAAADNAAWKGLDAEFARISQSLAAIAHCKW